MHVDQKQRAAAPFYDWSFRWAKAYKNKLAIKLAASLVKGSDWEAEDYRNKAQIGILSAVVPGNRTNNSDFNAFFVKIGSMAIISSLSFISFSKCLHLIILSS